jgi:hypothetical protein
MCSPLLFFSPDIFCLPFIRLSVVSNSHIRPEITHNRETNKSSKDTQALSTARNLNGWETGRLRIRHELDAHSFASKLRNMVYQAIEGIHTQVNWPSVPLSQQSSPDSSQASFDKAVKAKGERNVTINDVSCLRQRSSPAVLQTTVPPPPSFHPADCG